MEPAHAPAHGTPDAHALEIHGSWAPFIVAMGSFFVAMSLIYPKVALPIGLVLFFVGLGWWICEDVKRFRTVETLHKTHAGWDGPLWGVILFIGTEVLIFGSIFAIWFMGRHHALEMGHHWVPSEVHLPIMATAINTGVLVASGGTLHMGMLELRKGRYRNYLVFLAATLVLGAAFLVQQVREYIELVNEGLTLKGFEGEPNLFGSSFYMLTGTHGAHVAGGLFVLLLVFWRSFKHRGQTKDHHLLLETSAIYWHFVDVVWLFLFIVVYLQWI